MNDKAELTLRGLFFFSLPSILGSLLEPISGVVDSALIGHVDTKWLAALSLGVILLSSFTWVFNFLIHTSTQAVSEAYSRGDFEELLRKIKVALFLSVIVGLASSVLLYLFRYPLFNLIGVTPDLEKFVEQYYNVRLIGQTFLIVSFTCISILRGLSKVSLSFYIIFATTFLNILISWILLKFTSLGISSVAWGTVIASFIAMILSLALLFRGEISLDKLRKVSLGSDHWIHFGKNSFDMFCRSLILTTCFFVSTKLASRLGVESLAAHQILLELWLISSFLIDGVAVSANILSAKFKGQLNIESYKLMRNNVLLMGGLIGGLFTLSYFLFPEFLWSIFSSDQRVYEEIGTVWIYVALAQVVVAISYVYDGILFGLGKFRYLRTQMFFGLIISYVPFAFLSVTHNSLLMIWLGLISLGVYRLFIGFFGTRVPWES